LHPEAKEQRKSYVAQCLEGRSGPAIAATDYVRAYPDQIRAFVPMRYTVLARMAYGRSDTRANLRQFFEVDATTSRMQQSLRSRPRQDESRRRVARDQDYKIDVEKANPLGCD